MRSKAANQGRPLGRVRQLALFDRLLARLSDAFSENLILKGGCALEMRIQRARTTKDVDVSMTRVGADLLLRLQDAGALDLSDRLRFTIVVDPDDPAIHGEGVRYQGQRFRVRAFSGADRYGDPFGLDVSIGDALVGEPQLVEGSDDFAFVGATFAARATHPVPGALPPPPSSEAWERQHQRFVSESGLRWSKLPEVFAAASAFLNPVLAGTYARWDPARWEWEGIMDS